MKIVHFSDTHLGFSDLDVVNKDGINQREADFYKAFSDVIDAIIELKPDFVIHSGDLFHRASPSNRAITFALKELKRLEAKDIALILIAGNHSTPRTSTSSPILDALTTLKNVYASFLQRYEKFEFKDVVFHALPHINDERAIEEELDKIEANISSSKKNILIMHCSVGAHYLMHEFGEWVYPKEKEYIFEKMDYVALGHWHGFGAVGKHKNLFYAGSTERTSSSDRRDNKGYVVVEFEPNLKVSHKAITLRKSISFKIDALHYEEELKKLELNGIKDALVELTLYNLTPSTSIDITNLELKELFKDAMYLKIKREFKSVDGELIETNVESVSLENHFLMHLKESLSDKKEQERLAKKAKELFANYEESLDETN